MSKKVSFIVPVYNIEKYIGNCIESLLQQRGAEFEVILIDDGSSDKSGEICKQYVEKHPNIIKYIYQDNQGVSVARNQGILMSKGEWIFFVDGDDTISAKLLVSCLPFLNYENDICFVKHKEILDGKIIRDTVNRDFEKKIFSKIEFEEFILATFNRDYAGKFDYHNIKMATPCKFYKKSIIDKYKISFPVGVVTGEDALFNLQFYRYANKGVYIDSELYYHRIWESSVSQKYNPEIEKNFSDFHLKLLEFINTLDDPTKYKEAYMERCVWSFGFCCILNYCNRNNPYSYRERKKEFEEARKRYLYQIKNVKNDNFRTEKKLLFWCIKKNWFYVVDILCKLKRAV